MKTLDLGKVGIRVNKSPVERNLPLKRVDFQPSIEDKVDKEAKKARHTVLGDMDAIACGVEAWFEENTGYSRRVIETTVDIARGLGVFPTDRDMEKGRVI